MSDTVSDAELRAALVHVFEGSATLEERAAADGLISRHSTDAEVHTICRAANVSPIAMRARGPIAESFARVTMRDSSTLPGWATSLGLLLDDPTPDADIPDLGPDADDATREFAIAFSGFIRTAGRWLDRAVAALPTSVLPAGRGGLLGWLCRALMAHARLILIDERRARTVESTQMYAQQVASRSGWLSLLATYPVLGRLFGTEFELWQRECTRLLHRLAADWIALGEQGEPTLVDVSALALKRPPDAGPPLLLTLVSGKRVVYHGKDLRIAAWFAELVSELTRAGLTLALAPRSILARDRYAWADYVESSPCTDSAQVERYFTRVGMYLRLFQALRTIDMHGRNVIVVNEHPVFIDLETVLQPPRGLAGGSPVALAVRERFDASALAVSLLPIWLAGGPGFRALNVGGLNRGGDFVLPGDASHRVTRVEPTVPAIGDKLSSIGEHLPYIIAGYRSMSSVLAACEPVRELLSRVADLRVAVLWRSGFMHKRISDQSLAPLLMTDGRMRDAFLTHLVLGLPDDRSRQLALHELWAIRDGASPSFESRPASHAMYLPDGSLLPGVFGATALERVELVRSASDTDRDIDAIHSAIGTEAEANGDPPPVCEARPTARAEASNPLEHAIAIADFILGEAVTAGDEAMWLGATWLPTAGVRRIDILPADLMSGSAGLAVVFAYLHRRCGEPRFREAAVRALGPVSREVHAAIGRPQPLVGAFTGIGAQLYALGKCAELLDDPSYLDVVKRCLGSISPAVASPNLPHDVVLGASGVLLVAANLLEPFSRPPNLGHIASALREPVPPRRETFVDGTRWLAGLPNEREGIAWALARWDGSAKHVVLPEDSSLMTRIACARANAPLPEPVLAGDPRASLADLVMTLAARDAFRVPALTDRARMIADAIVTRRRETGRWLDDPYVADRYHLSAISGLSAVALAFARLDAPELKCCVRLVY